MTTIQAAKEILGESNVFCPEDWIKHFAGMVSFTEAQLAQAAQVPWSKDELSTPGLKQSHFLFLGVEECASGPLTLVVWHKLLQAGSGTFTMPNLEKQPSPLEVMQWNRQRSLRGKASHPKFIGDDDLGSPYAAKETCKFRWYLMPVGLVGAKSKGLFHIRQKLPSTYESASVIERVTANIVYFWQTGQYLDSHGFVRTRSLGGNGHEILISAMIVPVPDYDGIDVLTQTGNFNDPDIGIAASRKI
jgi:hypothetical protein